MMSKNREKKEGGMAKDHPPTKTINQERRTALLGRGAALLGRGALLGARRAALGRRTARRDHNGASEDRLGPGVGHAVVEA